MSTLNVVDDIQEESMDFQVEVWYSGQTFRIVVTEATSFALMISLAMTHTQSQHTLALTNVITKSHNQTTTKS